MERLPVDAFEKDILEALVSKGSLVLSAQTGTGKSTRVPQFLFRGLKGQILLLEPRRVAARSIAQRIAQEMGVKLGGPEVGYQIRFENKALPHTKLKVITEGILLQMLQSNPFLEGVEAVILDEFHERNLFTDLGIACCREIQQGLNENLKILVMSATLDAARLCDFLGAPRLEIPGRQFKVDIFNSPPVDRRSQDKRLEQKIEDRVRKVLGESAEGDLLVFLPGLGEIERCLDLCRPLAVKHGCEFLRLHSSLDSTEQDRIFQPSKKRKVIFSTNIAETSLTIPGVRFVIDSGLERVPEFDNQLLISKLLTQPISLFSAQQRSGRAGRTAEGTCLRLWSLEEEENMPLENGAQIRDSDLSPVLLQLLSWRGDLIDFLWFEKPPKENLHRSFEFLEDLGFVGDGKILDSAKGSLGLPLSLRGKRALAQPWRAEDQHDLAVFFAEQEKISVEQWRRLAGGEMNTSSEGLSFAQVLLVAFPDRVGRVQDTGRVQLVHGVGLDTSPDLSLKEGDLVIAYEVEFQRKGRHWDRRVKRALKISLADLKKVFPQQVVTGKKSFWDEDRKKPRVLESLFFKDLALEVGREMEPDQEMRVAALASYLLKNLEGLRKDFTELDRFFARLEFMSAWYPEDFAYDFESENFLEHLKLFLQGAKRADDVGEGKWLEIVKAFMSRDHLRLMDKEAPDALVFPGKPKPFRLRYEATDRVVVSGRIRDFSGITHLTPLAGGRVKILAELLAPNYRPVQITSDLEGFWIRTYPEVKKELKARYPKHFPD